MQSFVMKDKGFSTTEGFVFLDQFDKKLYQADAKNWTISREYTLNDSQGTEVLQLKQKLFSLSPIYTINSNGNHYATFRQTGSKFAIDFVDQPQITIQKAFGGKEYHFERENKPIASVNRKLISLLENCVIEVKSPEDAEIVMAGMVAIFAVNRKKVTRL